jgi:hypothetical protein
VSVFTIPTLKEYPELFFSFLQPLKFRAPTFFKHPTSKVKRKLTLQASTAQYYGAYR